MTQVAVARMTEHDARRLTERIRITAVTARESIEKLQGLITEAREGNAHVALGYDSWTAYLADVMGEQPLRLPRDQRQELVGYLAGEGMSTRAIAPIVGASVGTVHADRQVFSSEQVVNRETGEILDDPKSRGEEVARQMHADGSLKERSPRKVIGLDGKSYSQPEPEATRTPPRRALTDQFFDAAYDLIKAVERVHRLTEDDRWNQNAEKVAAKHRSDLLRLNDLLAEVIDRLA